MNKMFIHCIHTIYIQHGIPKIGLEKTQTIWISLMDSGVFQDCGFLSKSILFIWKLSVNINLFTRHVLN